MSVEIVRVSTGVMTPLIAKLTRLLGDEYKKLKGVRKEVSFLKDELSAMNAVLERLELMDKLEPDTKNWRDHVREMAYDMEDCIDDFMRDLGGAEINAGFFKKTAWRLKTLRARHQIAGQIKELKVLALEANERRTRYKIDDYTTSSGVVAIDPRVSAIYKEAAGLVGIDGPREELVSWLADTDQKLKVVSIVGFGGLGKTTLAKQVYDDIGGQFDFKAFFPISQRPDMAGLLKSLQSKLGIGESSDACGVNDIIDRLIEDLSHKRYFIIVDDLWEQDAWDIISCAFPENGNGSRVIVTTRVEGVACLACCNQREYIYRMKPLNDQDSRKLFSNRVFGSGNICPSQFHEISAEILKKCGGLPLAIITIASLLASRPERLRDEWESIRNSLGAQFHMNSTLEGMKTILNLSYMQLPLRLRACFLYLGMYPEDHDIERDDLVRQWVAEGFVSNLHGQDLEVVAKSYFNELINRSLIQPECTEYGEVFSCRVHDMMLDLILTKCAEHNFISVAYNSEDMAREQGRKYKVRRISLNLNTSVPDDGTMPGTIAASVAQIRSLARFGKSNYRPPLLLFKYLRVLVIDFPYWDSYPTLDLTTVNQLFHLRYVKVDGRHAVQLPTKIRGLVHLETLQLNCEYLVRNQSEEELQIQQKLPSDIVHLPCLSHLIVPSGTLLPEGIKNMKSLRTLSGYLRNSSLEDILGIGELTNLRDLSLSISPGSDLTIPDFEALMSSIGKIHDLRCLFLVGDGEDVVDQLASLFKPPPHIEVFQMDLWKFSGVPQYIAYLQYLRNLSLCVREISTDEIHILGELPSLVDLSLRVVHVLVGRAVIVATKLFPVLERCEFRSYDDDVTGCLHFEAGAMPKLRKLCLDIGQIWGGATPVGMEGLLGLHQIIVHVKYSSNYPQVRLNVDSVFWKASEVHPGRPSVTVDWY